MELCQIQSGHCAFGVVNLVEQGLGRGTLGFCLVYKVVIILGFEHQDLGDASHKIQSVTDHCSPRLIQKE